MAGNISKDNKFQGRPIIDSDSPKVEGGVYLGSGAREAIVVDSSDKNSEHAEKYRKVFGEFLTRLKDEGGKNKNKPGPLWAAYETVVKKMPASELKVDVLNTENGFYNDQKVNLANYIGEAGVCRHQALLGAWILQKAQAEGLVDYGVKVRVHRNEIPGIGGHAWVSIQNENGKEIILDATQKYLGTTERAFLSGARPPWNYKKV